MIGLTLESVKQSILDSQKIVNAMDRAESEALKKFGAFVRQRAKTSIRKRKSTSEAGRPPSSHTGLLRDHILFVAEPAQHNVIIGPMLLNSARSRTALSALEHGGPSMVVRQGKPIQVMIGARPFMQPAFDQEMAKTGGPAKLWENQLKE